MGALQSASKSSIFAAGISAITAGLKLIESDWKAGGIALVTGVVLVVIWAVLVEKQSIRAGEKAAEKILEKLKGGVEAE